MTDRLTYGQLFDKLRQLGYVQQTADVNGSRLLVFQHAKHARATIYLPDMPQDEPVASLHLLGVRATLKHHGVSREDPDRLFMESLPVQNT
jgi:hypothetical protein